MSSKTSQVSLKRGATGTSVHADAMQSSPTDEYKIVYIFCFMFKFVHFWKT